jgi:hypothetical protein
MLLRSFIYSSLIALVVLQGCASTSAKFTQVDPSNGINRYEAIMMAKSEIENAGLKNYFKNLKPILREDPYASKYPEYWFVDFTPKIYFDFWGYLVVINKKTGEIIHSRDYYWPVKIADLDWVFNK